MAFLDKLFGLKDPQEEATPYLEQLPGIAHQTYDPYVQAGQQAQAGLAPQYQSMAQDPAQFYEKLLSQYKPSRSYQQQLQEATRAAGASAAAGGMRGSQQDIQNAAQIASTLSGEDMQRWLRNITGLMGTGMEGQERLAGRGFEASKGLGSDIMGITGQRAGLAFQGARESNQRIADLIKALTSGGAFVAGTPTGTPGAPSTLGADMFKMFI